VNYLRQDAVSNYSTQPQWP